MRFSLAVPNPRKKWWYPAVGPTMDALDVALRALRLEASRVEVSDHRIFDDTPRGAAPIVIAQISDLHLHFIGRREENAVAALEAARPDIVVMTGDSVDDPKFFPRLDAFLDLIRPIGAHRFAILGNWEHFAELHPGEVAALHERHGVQVLHDRTVAVTVRDRTLAITGFDDVVGGAPDVDRALRDLPADLPHLLLAHCPIFRNVLTAHPAWPARDPRARLMLSGHTHGGQIRFGPWAPVVPVGTGEYVDGWYRSPELDLYVNRGIGMSMVPVRFGATAEISVFRWL